MHRATTAAIILAVITSIPQSGFPQDAPAQPLAEAEVARQFEVAAPGLFKEWLSRRPDVLKALADGQYAELGGGQIYYCFEFSVCVDAVPPGTYSIDVRKTDSILTPFVGSIIIPVKVSCTNQVLSSSMRRKLADELAPSCLGHTYDECAAAGGKEPSGFSKFNNAPCAGRDDLKFSYEDEVHVSYAWRQGKWEFQEETKKKPRDASIKKS